MYVFCSLYDYDQVHPQGFRSSLPKERGVLRQSSFKGVSEFSEEVTHSLSHPKSDPPFFRRNKTQITQLLNLIARREKSDGLYRPARKTVAPLGQTDHDLL